MHVSQRSPRRCTISGYRISLAPWRKQLQFFRDSILPVHPPRNKVFSVISALVARVEIVKRLSVCRTMSLSSVLQPVTLVALEALITALAIGFTSTSSQRIRLTGLVLVAANAYLAVLTTLRQVTNVMWAGVLAGASTYMLRYVELVLIDRWDFDDDGPPGMKSLTEKKMKMATERNGGMLAFPQPATAWRRLRFGFSVTLNPRLLNTPYQVKNVPTWYYGKPQQVPSRGKFLQSTTISILLSYAFVDVCSLGLRPERNAVVFSHNKVALFKRLDSLSPEEIVIRASASLIFWLNIFCILRILHGTLSFLAISSGFSEVKEWIPPFGSLAEAYSVRRFWGYVDAINSFPSLAFHFVTILGSSVFTAWIINIILCSIFWHQMYRQTFGSPARFLVHDVLRIPQHTLVARYSRILSTFFISGLLHLSTDIAVGIKFGESGSIRFFCTQALGILLEDGVQALYHYSIPKEQRSWKTANLAKIIGYVWLGGFLAWSTPTWAYPALRRITGEATDLVVPFSILKLLAWKVPPN